MCDLENKAITVGEDVDKLSHELREARSLLRREYLKHFECYTIDFGNKRMKGSNGYLLQWQLRHKPNEPIAYNNQQTSRGTVLLISNQEHRSL